MPYLHDPKYARGGMGIASHAQRGFKRQRISELEYHPPVSDTLSIRLAQRYPREFQTTGCGDMKILPRDFAISKTLRRNSKTNK